VANNSAKFNFILPYSCTLLKGMYGCTLPPRVSYSLCYVPAPIFLVQSHVPNSFSHLWISHSIQ